MSESFSVRLSPRGHFVMPKEIRARHGWHPGTELVVEDLGDRVILRETSPVPEARLEDLVGCAGYEGPRRTLEAMEEGIARGACEDR